MSWTGRAGLALAAVIAAVPVAAQTPERPWKLDAELGASVLYGSSEQTAVLSRSRFEWTDPHWELGLGGSFDYGEAQDSENGRFVNKRSWTAQLSADYLPSGRFSPFVFGAAEGSLQRQIDMRTSGGAGGRYRFVDNERSRVDLSLAALAERTKPRATATEAPGSTTIGRWSVRFRARHKLAGDRMELDLVTFYQPRIDGLEEYTLDVTSSMQYALTSIVGLKVSLVNRYDSMAETRGARSNTDGQLFFSVTAALR